MYFVLTATPDEEDLKMLARHIEDEVRDKGVHKVKCIIDSLMNSRDAALAHDELYANPAIRKTVIRGIETDEDSIVFDPHDFGIKGDSANDIGVEHVSKDGKMSMTIGHENCPISVETRGVKDGLKSKKRMMSHKDFHKAFSHMGNDAS